MAYAPELLILVAIDIVLVMSLLSCLFETYFPTALPYLLQLVALFGFGQLYVSNTFMSIFTEDVRFWYSLFYLISGFVCVLIMNAYVVLIKRTLAGGMVFLGGVSMPTAFSAAYILSVFINKIPVPFFMMPPIPITILYEGVFLSICILFSGIVLSLRPDIFEHFIAQAHQILLHGFKSGIKTAHFMFSKDKTGESMEDGIPRSEDGITTGEAEKTLPLSYLLNYEQVLDQDGPMTQRPKDFAEDDEAKE